MRKFYVTTLICMALSSVLAAQQRSDYEEIIPPSPTLSEFAKYSTVPVSLYTGVPDIKIPLTEIKCGPLVVPVYLSYHAGGITVDQIASEVGLGWVLNAGGVISQHRRGGDDLAKDLIYKDFSELSAMGPGEFTEWAGGNRHDRFNPVYNIEADIFSYNVLGLSGQFVYGRDMIPYEARGNNDLAFEMDRKNLSFRAKDRLGNDFLFADRETMSTMTYFYDGFADIKKEMIQSAIPTGTPHLTSGISLSSYTSEDGNYSIDWSYGSDTLHYFSRHEGCLVYNLATSSPAWGLTMSVTFPKFHNTLLRVLPVRAMRECLLNRANIQPLQKQDWTTQYVHGLDTLIATARSNKVSVCLGFQDFFQHDRDYGANESNVIQNTVGIILAAK